jgi:hypothetical protein
VARRGRGETSDRDKSVDTSRVPAGRGSVWSSGRSQIGESGVSKSDWGGSSGEEEDEEDRDSRWSAASVSTSASASSWASSSSEGVQHGVMGSGSACDTMGCEGGGEGGGRYGMAADGCDVRGGPLSGSCVCVSGAGLQERRVRGLGLLEREDKEVEDDGGDGGDDMPAACDGESSDKAGSGTVCFGSESVGGGDG